MRLTWGVLALGLVAALPGGVLASQAHLTGTASIETPVTLPPGAVFEAVLEDVSAAGAPAPAELGRKVIADPGGAPFAFDIAYDPAGVAADRTYSVRAQVSVGRRLVFVSDTVTPVLTRGAPDHADVRMIKVGDTTAEAATDPGRDRRPRPAAARELRRRHALLRLRRDPVPPEPLARPGVPPPPHLEGQGHAPRFGRALVGRPDPPGARPARRRGGARIPDSRPGPDAACSAVTTSGSRTSPNTSSPPPPDFAPFEPHLPLRGMLTYTAKEARFTECLTGRDYPLVEDGDYEALEHAYLAAGAEAGGPIMASFDGGIIQVPKADGSAGTEAEVMVERFVGVWPGETCERTLDAAQLTNTYWKILRLGDTEVAAGEGLREPNLILRAGDPRFTATIGCDQMTGSYALDGNSLSFGTSVATLMACPAPLDDWEKQLAHVLTEAAGWRIDGQTLELLDAGGNALALLQAVYLY